MESVFPNIPMIWYIVSRTRFFHNHNVHNTCKTITNVPDIESLWTICVNLFIHYFIYYFLSHCDLHVQISTIHTKIQWRLKTKIDSFWIYIYHLWFTNFVVPKHVLMVEKGKFNIASTDKLHFIVMTIGERS